MSISLKEQLRIIREGVHYHAPFINITQSGAQDSSVRGKATRLFYDFYAMELMHRQLGSPRPDPAIKPGDETDPTKARILTPNQARQYRAAVQRGADPIAAGAAGWEDVEFPPMGGTIVPAQLRKVIDQVFDEVTIQLSRKLSAHLRLSIMQEFRYIITRAHSWQMFTHKLISLHNSQGKISHELFNNIIKEIIPSMVGHEDSVLRLLKFCKYYQGITPDPFDIVSKNQPKPEASAEPEVEPQTSPEEEPQASAPQEPDDTDYDMPSVEIPPGADWGDDDWKSANTDVEKAKMHKWLKTHQDISESIIGHKMLLNEMSPSEIVGVNQAIKKSGLTWDDILLAYNNLGWGGAYGGPKWGAGTEALIKLAAQTNQGNIEDMASIVDHIYDLEHNSGALLNKGGMYVAPADLDRRAKTTHIARYLPYVSPLIKRLIIRVLGYVSDMPEIEKDITKVTQSPDQPFPETVQAMLTANKFVKSSVGNEWKTEAPFQNKKGESVDNQYTAKFHTNGLYSVQDTMSADVKVFKTPEDLDKWLKQNVFNFIKPVVGTFKYSSPSSTPPVEPSTSPQQSPAVYALSNVEINTLQILANQTAGTITVDPTVNTMGVTWFKDKLGGVLSISKKAVFPTGQKYVINHVTKDQGSEAWSFPNWNQAYSFIANNFAALTQTDTLIKNTATSTSQLYPQVSTTQLPPPSPSKVSYTAHVGISKPPAHTIRLTSEDENTLAGAGFTPTMQGSDVWYINKKIGDVAKFFPNDVAKILIMQGNTKTTVTKKISDAIAWLTAKYQGATVSPLIAPTAPSTVGSKAGAMFEKTLTDAGFTWDSATGQYYTQEMSPDKLKISPYPKSTYTNGKTGEVQHFNSLPEMAMCIKKKVLANPAPAATPQPPLPPGVPPSPTDEKFQAIHDDIAKELAPFMDEKGNIPSVYKKESKPYKNSKIAAIMHLRNVMLQTYKLKLPLAESKWLIENVKRFLNYVKYFGLPSSLIDIDKAVEKWSMPDETPMVPEDDYKEMLIILGPYMNAAGEIPMSTPGNSSNKITAIKAFKNFIYEKHHVNLSLANTKKTIEHADDFLEYVRINGINYFLKNIEDVMNKWSYEDFKPKENPDITPQNDTPEVKEVPEAKLPELLEKHGFKFKETINGNAGSYTMYQNSNNDNLYLYNIGSSILVNSNIEHKFETVAELVNYLEKMDAPDKTKWTTGDVELDEELDAKGFKIVSNMGYKMQFINKDGTIIIYDKLDKSSSVETKNGVAISFVDVPSLIDHLKNSSPIQGDKALDLAHETTSVELSSDNENKLGFNKFKDGNGNIYYYDYNYDVVFLYDGHASVIEKNEDGVPVKTFNTHPAAIQYLLSKKSKNDSNKKVLAGTEDMPWSGMNYPIWWNTQPSNVPLGLTTFDEATMKSMGWIPSKWGGGIVYQKDLERMAFYKDGVASYWSNFNSGGVTQTWPSVEDAIRWLWKNKNTSNIQSSKEVPYSGLDYKIYYNSVYSKVPKNQSVVLIPEDKQTMKSMGFVEYVDTTAGLAFNVMYEKSDTKEKAFFFASGRASYWQDQDGPHYFNTPKELMQFLWDKYAPNIQEGSLRDYLRKWLI